MGRYRKPHERNVRRYAEQEDWQVFKLPQVRCLLPIPSYIFFVRIIHTPSLHGSFYSLFLSFLLCCVAACTTVVLPLGGGRFAFSWPQASVAPRPMMPRCSSLPAPAEASSDTRSRFLKRSASILGLPETSPRPGTVAPSHGGSGGDSGGYVWSALSKSSSVPSTNTPGSHSAAAAAAEDQNTALSSDHAWLELQREMGSLKADNRMFLRGSQGGGGGGGGRGSNKARPLLASGSAASVLSKSLAEISTVCAEATTDLLAKTLSLGLDSPKPAWEGEKSGTAMRSPSPKRNLHTLVEYEQPHGRVDNMIYSLRLVAWAEIGKC